MKTPIHCSCIYCREVRSAKGIVTHVERTHLKLTKYSSGHNGQYDLLAKRHQLKVDKYLLSPNKCTLCGLSLEYTKRSNKFCSRSCAATWNNSNKDYSTFKPGPAKHGSISKQCAWCNSTFDTKSKKRKFCSSRCATECKNAPRRANRTEWQNYRADCQFRFSIKDYPTEFEFDLINQHGWYSASNRGNNLTGVSRDHMVSCRYGFENNLPVEHIRHPANCKLIIHTENSSKNKKNSITYDELLSRIKLWDERHK